MREGSIFELIILRNIALPHFDLMGIDSVIIVVLPWVVEAM